MATDPKFWRALSTLALVVAVLGLILGKQFGWIALIVSGVAFGIELLLNRSSRAPRNRP